MKPLGHFEIGCLKHSRPDNIAKYEFQMIYQLFGTSQSFSQTRIFTVSYIPNSN